MPIPQADLQQIENTRSSEANVLAPAKPAIGQKRFAFISSCPEPWGGSEELWSGVAHRFAKDGHKISVIKTHVDNDDPNIRHLKEVCEHVEDYDDHRDLTIRLANRLLPGRWLRGLPDLGYPWLSKFLRKTRPHLVIIAQGENFDGMRFAQACQQNGLRYVVIAQKATDSKWPEDRALDLMRRFYTGAERAYFVSRHNRDLTECQIGLRLVNAEVVSNPFITPVNDALPWPAENGGLYRLACLARLFIEEKGQDVLLRVLGQEKWKARPLEVNFYGRGIHSEALQGMARLLGLTNVNFPGFTTDVTGVWKTHHALVLSSRCEGLPLSVIEAMICGRPVIATASGGTSEILDDNCTGFVASAATPQSVDEALERAWQRRHEWQAIGKLAAESARRQIPADPIGTLATKIMELC